MPNNHNAYGIVNPYGAGDVRFDTGPVTNYYLRQEFQKRAKDEALDKYFLDMQKNVTPAGMRNQEIPILVEKSKQLQQIYLKDRAAIKNPALDNGEARTRYFGHYQDMMGLIQGSKNELAGEAAFHKLRANPEVAARIGEGTMQAADIVRLPIGDPRRTLTAAEMLDEVTFSPKRLTPQQQQSQFKNYKSLAGKPSEKRIFVMKDPKDDFNDIYEIKEQYTDEQLGKAADNAILAHQSSPELSYTFSNPHPDNFEALNKIYRRVKGKDIETEAEAHGAEAMYLMENEKGKEISVPNRKRIDDYNNAQANAMANKKDGFKRAAQQSKEQRNERFIANRLEKLKKGAGQTLYVVRDGKVTDAYQPLGAPSQLLKTFEADHPDGYAGSVHPDNIVMFKDGTFGGVRFKRDPTRRDGIAKDKKGNPMIDERVNFQRMDEDAFKLQLGKVILSGNALVDQYGDEEEPSAEEAPATAPTQPKFKGLPKAGKF